MGTKRLIVVCSLLLSCGGCILSKGADTVVGLDVERANDSLSGPFGLRQCYWTDSNDGVIIVGHGWHPREHETYTFFAVEGYPLMQGRRLVLRPNTSAENSSSPLTYELIFMLEQFPRTHSFPIPTSLPENFVPEKGYLVFVGQCRPPERNLWGNYVLALENVKLQLRSNPNITARIHGKIVASRDKYQWVQQEMDSPPLTELVKGYPTQTHGQ